MLKNILICIIASFIAILSAINSYAAVTKRKQPDLALSVPLIFNGLAAETLASATLKKNIAENGDQFPDTIDKETSAIATRSFLSEPTASEAIAVLAFSKQDNDRQSLMEKAYSLSRREQLINGWLISDSSRNNNLGELLNYYDISMRTKRSSEDLLLPIMVNTLSNQDFIAPLQSLLVKQPPWSKRFWQIASVSDAQIKNITTLRRRLLSINIDKQTYADGDLIKTLVENNMFDDAYQLRDMLLDNRESNVKIANNEVVSNYSFSDKQLYPPLDWQLYSNGEYGASLSDRGLYLSAINNSGGRFARQLISLNPKIYQVSIDLLESISDSESLSLQLRCAEKENKALNIIIDLKKKNEARTVNNLNGLCQYFWLSIDGFSSDDALGLDNIIQSISIKELDRI